jgi:hypothetical protein
MNSLVELRAELLNELIGRAEGLFIGGHQSAYDEGYDGGISAVIIEIQDVLAEPEPVVKECLTTEPEPGLPPSRSSCPASDEAVDALWRDFWKPIVAPSGEVDLNLVKLELFDFSQLMADASEVYMHVTGGMISKVTTLPSEVISVADDHVNKLCDEWMADSADPEPVVAENATTESAVDRLREAIEKYGTPEPDNRVTISLDDIERIAFRAGIGELKPEPYVVTDAMEADALAALFQRESRDVAIGYYTVRSRMRAALEAAERARRQG